MTSIAKKLYRKAVNAYINKVDPKHEKSRLLYEGELHVPLHNFTGPGTRLDMPGVRNMRPYNDIDACSKKHDLEYEEIKNSTMDKESKAEAIQKADRDAIECYDKHKDQYGYSLAKAGISGKINIENLLSLIKKKPSILYGGAFVTNLSARKDLPEVIPNNIKRALKKITANINNISPFGSWIYKAQLYPGDIDLIELEEISGTKEEAIRKFVNMTKSIVKKIVSSDGEYYIGDIKAGIDSRYLLDIGYIKYTSMGEGSIVDFNIEKILTKSDTLRVNKLLAEEEYKNIIDKVELVVKTKSLKDHEELHDFLREFWLLRWTPEEIMKGYKILRGNLKYNLSEAIQDPTLTKIDMWTSINGRFIEISNVLTYKWITNNGEKITLNYENDIMNIVSSLKYEVEKYAFSSNHYKPTKMMKRMWSISRLEGWVEDVVKLTPLLQSDIGRLSQIVSDIDVIKMIMENVRKLPYKELSDEVSTIKYRLSNVYEIFSNEDLHSINRVLDKAADDLRSKKKRDSNTTLDHLIMIKEHLNDILQEYTLKKLEDIGYYPPPSRYLPS